MSQPASLQTNKKYGLRFKLTLGLILIIGILFSGHSFFSIYSHLQTRRSETIAQLDTVARLMLSSITGLGEFDLKSARTRAYLENFFSVAIIQNTSNKDLAFGLVLDSQGQFITGRALPELTIFPGQKKYKKETEVLAEIARMEGILLPPMRTKIYTLKFAEKGTAGKLIVGASLERFEKASKRDLIAYGVVFASTLLALILYASWALGNFVIKPLQQVVSAMGRAEKGDLSTELDLKRSDEMGMLADSYNYMIKGLREREQLRDMFNRYVSKQVYAKIRKTGINIAGEARNVTVLFSDIRGFTTLSEQLPAENVVAMLNEYFTHMVDIIFKYDGYLNKYIGDAIMAVFNAPLEQIEHELYAIKTALEMIEALAIFNARRTALGMAPIHIGIGINTGTAIAGNIGHEQRLEYTVIGDAVNTAQRLESQTKVAGETLLVSEVTYRAVADQVIAKELPPVKVKGRHEMVLLYAISGLKN